MAEKQNSHLKIYMGVLFSVNTCTTQFRLHYSLTSFNSSLSYYLDKTISLLLYTHICTHGENVLSGGDNSLSL